MLNLIKHSRDVRKCEHLMKSNPSHMKNKGLTPSQWLQSVSPQSATTHLWEMLICGIIGLYVSFVLSIEAWQLASNSGAKFGCDISSVVSCSTVALSPQAQILGFPNAFLGIFFESIVITATIIFLLGGQASKLFMLGLQALYTVALGFAYWLFLQSYFVIHALCPWCLLITLTTTLVWFSLLQVNTKMGSFPVPAFWLNMVEKKHAWVISFLLCFTVVTMVIVRYGHGFIA